MSDSTSLTVTVNRPDDTELEITAACGSKFEQIGWAIGQALELNGVKAGEWSSLVVTILPPHPPLARGRPKLTVVN
jgi:hypothetical protein